MKRDLPSLLAVRYFESVGRNLSFTLAASELHVTQAAVSHQVRLLESELKLKLFTRLHQRIELTPEGVQLLQVTTECLNKLSEAFDNVCGRVRSERIHLSVTPLISSRWVMPQLGDFLATDKNTEIIFHHSLEPPNEREAKYDLKIFFSKIPLTDSSLEFLFADALVPICTPALLRGHEDLSTNDLLEKLSIVHEFNYDWWQEWCRRSGTNERTVEKGIVIDDPVVLESAALLGRGIILGSMFFLRNRVEQGELVYPLGIEQKIMIYYYISTQPNERRSNVINFREWLMSISKKQRT